MATGRHGGATPTTRHPGQHRAATTPQHQLGEPRAASGRAPGRRLAVLAALLLVSIAVIGCTRTSEHTVQDSAASTTTRVATGSQPPATHPGTVDAASAVELARQFVGLYGTLSPANPTPGQTWIASWRQLATDNVVADATANFDKLWSWTWEQRVQCHDVTVTGDVDVRSTEFGTVVVHIPAKRYVLGLTARADEGAWQDLAFEVTVGARNPRSATDPRLAVYLVTLTVVTRG